MHRRPRRVLPPGLPARQAAALAPPATGCTNCFLPPPPASSSAGTSSPAAPPRTLSAMASSSMSAGTRLRRGSVQLFLPCTGSPSVALRHCWQLGACATGPPPVAPLPPAFPLPPSSQLNDVWVWGQGNHQPDDACAGLRGCATHRGRPGRRRQQWAAPGCTCMWQSAGLRTPWTACRCSWWRGHGSHPGGNASHLEPHKQNPGVPHHQLPRRQAAGDGA